MVEALDVIGSVRNSGQMRSSTFQIIWERHRLYKHHTDQIGNACNDYSLPLDITHYTLHVRISSKEQRTNTKSVLPFHHVGRLKITRIAWFKLNAPT